MRTFDYVSGLPIIPKLKTKTVNSQRWYITPDGSEMPSITTVLGHYEKSGISKWRNKVGHSEANKISNRAATRGTKFHTLLEKYISNQPVKEILTEEVMPDMAKSFMDILPTVDRINNIHYSESTLYSEKLRVAGRTDVIGNFDDVLSVIDFKTAAKEKDEKYIQNYFEQATAYGEMYEERVGRPIGQIVVIIMVDHFELPQIFVRNKKDYIGSLKDKIEKFYKEHQI